MNLLKIYVENFIVIMEHEIVGDNARARIIYPVQTPFIEQRFNQDHSAEYRLNNLVEQMSQNFLIFRNILFDFPHYKRLTKRFRITKLHEVVKLLNVQERNILLCSLATNYFYESFDSVPSNEIKMDLFVALLELPTIDKFKEHYAPEMSLQAFEASYDIKVLDPENRFKDELFNFDRQLN